MEKIYNFLKESIPPGCCTYNNRQDSQITDIYALKKKQDGSQIHQPIHKKLNRNLTPIIEENSIQTLDGQNTA